MSLDPRELTFIRMLRGLSRDEILAFIDACVPVSVPPGTVLVEQGSIDRCMLFILDGVVEVSRGLSINNIPLRRFTRGDQLGELSLLGFVARRTATIKAVEDTDILVLDEEGLSRLRGLGNPIPDLIESEALRALAGRIRETDRKIAQVAVGHQVDDTQHGPFRSILRVLGAGRPNGRPPGAVAVLEQSPHFHRLTKGLRIRLAGELQAVAFAKGEPILHEGEMEGDAWIVATGRVGAYRQTRDDRREHLGTLGPGALFGHLSIVDGDSRTATCIAEEPTWLYRVPRELCEVLVENRTVEGRALRRCLADALARQLQQANEAYEQAVAAARSHKQPDLFDNDDLQAIRKARESQGAAIRG